MVQDVPDAAVLLKDKANALFRKSLFTDALSLYNSILQQFKDSVPASFTRVVRCNLAACFIELEEYDNALDTLGPIFLTSTFDIIPRHEQEVDPIFQKAHFRKARCLYEVGSATLTLEALNAYRDLAKGKGKVDDMEPQRTRSACNKFRSQLESNPNMRPVRYGIGYDTSFVKHATVPSDLCW